MKEVLDKPWNMELVCVIILASCMTRMESEMSSEFGREWSQLVQIEKGSSLEMEVRLLSDVLKNIESFCCEVSHCE